MDATLRLGWYVYCGGNPIIFIDPTGLIGIMPDGSIYMDEDDTETDKILLEYKIEYENAKTDEERSRIATLAAALRKESQGEYKVRAEHPLSDYYIPDITEAFYDKRAELELLFKAHPLNIIWFMEHVKTNSIADLKNLKGTVFHRKSYSYHIIFEGTVYRADAPGNIMFGYLGKICLFNDDFLLYGAGGYQYWSDAGVDQYGNPYPLDYGRIITGYGDNPGDTEQIIIGINMYYQSRNMFYRYGDIIY